MENTNLIVPIPILHSYFLIDYVGQNSTDITHLRTYQNIEKKRIHLKNAVNVSKMFNLYYFHISSIVIKINLS